MNTRPVILIVDDEPQGRATLEALLHSSGYQLIFAATGAEALAQVANLTPDLILLDVMMPVMDGFEVCRRLRADPTVAEIPIILLTALDDRDSRLRGIEAGADDFITKPFDRIELRARVRTITRLNRYRRLLLERSKFERLIERAPVGIALANAQRAIRLANPAFLQMLRAGHATSVIDMDIRSLVAPEQIDACAAWLDGVFARLVHVTRIETEFVRLDGERFPVEIDAGHTTWDEQPAVQLIVHDITERKQAQEHIRQAAIANAALFDGLQRSNAELTLAYDATIEGWSRVLDLRDKETEGHSRRVTEMSLRLAETLGSGTDELVHIRRGALLHDIGKMGIPDAILLKPGPLTDEEWVIMRKHPVYAYDMLAPIAYLRPALDIPYCHHEKWDGTGYPRGLAGDQIPLAARIFAVVDVWDAMRSDRPYRKGRSEAETRAHIQSLAGSHFDPHMVQVFLELTP